MRALVAIVAVLLAPAAAGAQSPDPPGHDPTLIRQGDWWYAITTSEGELARRFLPVQRSRDLVHWEQAGKVFDVPPGWVVHELGTLPADFWAPHVQPAVRHPGAARLRGAPGQRRANRPPERHDWSS